jgi:SPP1 gp7 family putative phage head morphogenesis protein
VASIFEQAESFKRDLLKRDKAAAARLTDAYAIAWKSIKTQLDALTKQMTEAKLRGEDISQAWLARQARYLSLLRQVGEQLGRFAEIAGREITREERKAIQVAEADAQRLLIAGADQAGIEASFAQLPKGAVENMVGFMGNGSPLKELLDRIPRRGGALVARALQTGLIKGRSSNAIASEIRIGLNGSLAKAIQIARTEINRAYRETSHQTYEANSDVLEGWIWLSALNSRSCVACVALHGSFHAIDERMKAHVSCRCTQVPAVKSIDLGIQKGPDWFAKQPAKIQKEIFNQESKYKAYRDGELSLEDFVGLRRDPDWGDSYEVLGLERARRGEGQFPTEPERSSERSAPIIPIEEPGPRGIPVSRALKPPSKGDVAQAARRVLDIIDRLHGDGNLPEIPIKASASKARLAGYSYFTKSGESVEIAVGRHTEEKELAIAHEIGHFLDHKGIAATGNYGSGEAFRAFQKAVSRSKAVQDLLDFFKATHYRIKLRDGREVKQLIDRDYIRYLLREKELWARAYSQWVAVRSNDKRMLEQVRKTREDEHPGTAASLWADEDFEPVAQAIDDLMETMNWRKS